LNGLIGLNGVKSVKIGLNGTDLDPTVSAVMALRIPNRLEDGEAVAREEG